MDKQRFFLSGLIGSMVLLFSCGGGDEVAPPAITASGISIMMDENPTNGEVLGTVTGTADRGNLIFSLSNQNPAGAMAIDASTGELTVADASKFDFETNPTLTAKGSVTVEGVSESANISITLNNMPEIVIAPDLTMNVIENLSLIHI